MVETGQDLEFFKVFLPEFSSHELVIPPAFIDILKKPLPKEALLLDEIGRSWSVEIKTEDTEERFRVLFKKGWESFAEDQSLEFGDFLVFCYDGDLRFSVTIFAKGGCKRDLGGVIATDRSRVSDDKEPVVVKPVDIFTKPELRRGCGMRVKRKRKRKRDSVKEQPRVLVQDEPESLSTTKTKPEYQEITRRNVNRDGDTYDISWVLGKKHKGFEEPVDKTKIPHFVRTINNASIHKLEIPTTFLKCNGIQLEEDIKICDENGKKWPSKIVNCKRQVNLSREPWLSFCRSHKLMKNNKCSFEFIVASNGRCNEIHVRIFRGSLLTTITKSGYRVLAM
ncbi:putative B3 domain-containing protein [Cardamine amara subsp. amara]|uniref:B3 domain-containing protein n=1 Tax=Cardamine amara subsp. amara TaxID=228776 RepID=A0ABD0ZPG4_CARAN